MLQYLLIIYMHAPLMMSNSTTAIKSFSNLEEKPCIFDITLTRTLSTLIFNISITQMHISLSSVLIMLSRILLIAINMVYIE